MTTRTRTGLMAVGIVGAVFLCGGGVVVGIVMAKKDKGASGIDFPSLSGPSEKQEGERWGVDELAAYLKANGLPGLQVIYPEKGLRQLRPSPYFLFRPTAKVEGVESHKLKDAVSVFGVGGAFVSSASQKDSASQYNSEHPGGALAWGRFLIRGDPVYVAKIKAILN